MTNTKSIQQKICVSRCTGTPPTADSKRDLHVLHRTEKWNQIWLLEHKTNVAAAEITQRIEIGIRSRKSAICKIYFACRRNIQKPGQHQKSRLSRAAWADDADELACPQFERRSIESNDVSVSHLVVLADFIQNDNAFAGQDNTSAA
jgi:hypothetical protein